MPIMHTMITDLESRSWDKNLRNLQVLMKTINKNTNKSYFQLLYRYFLTHNERYFFHSPKCLQVKLNQMIVLNFYKKLENIYKYYMKYTSSAVTQISTLLSNLRYDRAYIISTFSDSKVEIV